MENDPAKSLMYQFTSLSKCISVLAEAGLWGFVSLSGSMAFQAPEQLEARIAEAENPLSRRPRTDRCWQDMWSGMVYVLNVLLGRDPFFERPAEDRFPENEAASSAVRLLESQTEWVSAECFVASRVLFDHCKQF